MFFYVLTILWAMIVIEGAFAYSYGLWSRKQASDRVWPKPFAVFIEHGGMWGDAIIVSPLTAWACHFYFSEWRISSIIYCFIISIVITGLMLNHWCKGSRKIVEPFAIDEELTEAGWWHGAYTVITLAIILLIFFCTSHVNHTFAYIFAIGLAIHIAIGLLQPELNTFGKVKSSTVMQVVIAWTILFCGWSKLIH